MSDGSRGMAVAMLVLLMLGTGCLHRGAPGGTPVEHLGHQPSAVLDREDLAAENGMLLDAMARRIPVMRISFDVTCPSITLRGVNTLPGLTEPEVYVDGIRGADTCILNNLAVSDAHRVEIYSQGVTSRPGYVTSARGLILIFTRQR